MKPVFLDTVGLIALWDKADQWHADADAAFTRIQAASIPYVTTTFILAECGNAAARKPFRGRVVVLERLLASSTGLIHPDEQDWRDAWAAYDRGRPGDPGLVDCVSFVIMRKLGITDAFTNDQHFKTAGFNPLF